MSLFSCVHKFHKVGPSVGCFMRFQNFYYIQEDLYYMALYYKYVLYRKECKATKSSDMSHLKNRLFKTGPKVKSRITSRRDKAVFDDRGHDGPGGTVH
jgi:hypothetical protein